MKRLKSALLLTLVGLGVGVAALAAKTYRDVSLPSLAIRSMVGPSERFAVLDRRGEPLAVSYQTRFNMVDIRPLHQVPETLRKAVVTAEDRRFFEHHGVDWQARLAALWQDLRNGRRVRGASTISEQVVRIVHPRPRTLWSRWVEGFEAAMLERHYSKGEILEFYLNQVPYAANRRGVAQAARYYFNRDLQTLTEKEMLALAVLPRAPSALDLYRNPKNIEPAIARLSKTMEQRLELPAGKTEALAQQAVILEPPQQTVSAPQFVSYIRDAVPYRLSDSGVLLTTLDGALQQKAQALLDERVSALSRKRVHNGAVLIADHTTGEILAYAVAGTKDERPGSSIDAVRTPRQPGSAMKPFLYALALDRGWSPATVMDDAPMAEAIGTGLHDFHNYSHVFYGKISLREALGNSLNIPALETIAFVTPERYLDTLHALGFASLAQPASFYNDGLALGNGEVSLFEMVQGFSTLANRGVNRPLTAVAQSISGVAAARVYSDEAASLIGNILSDPFARRLEFGAGSVLNLPTQTAVKTGTSTDYRDAWVLGYDARFTVGVWFGNLDATAMDGVTGSTGPALVLRGLFNELQNYQQAKPLYLSPKLVQMEVCGPEDEKLTANCFPHSEYFILGTEPKEKAAARAREAAGGSISLIRPTEGLQLAYDPRIPREVQAFEFLADGVAAGQKVQWVLNGQPLSQTDDGRFMWPVERGNHSLVAQVVGGAGAASASPIVHFTVK